MLSYLNPLQWTLFVSCVFGCWACVYNIVLNLKYRTMGVYFLLFYLAVIVRFIILISFKINTPVLTPEQIVIINVMSQSSQIYVTAVGAFVLASKVLERKKRKRTSYGNLWKKMVRGIKTQKKGGTAKVVGK